MLLQLQMALKKLHRRLDPRHLIEAFVSCRMICHIRATAATTAPPSERCLPPQHDDEFN